jgi:hypothetical protein
LPILHLGRKNGGYYLNLDKIDKTQFPEEYHELIEYAVLACQKDCFGPAKSYPTLVEHLKMIKKKKNCYMFF